jgi:hypothetical protein
MSDHRRKPQQAGEYLADCKVAAFLSLMMFDLASPPHTPSLTRSSARLFLSYHPLPFLAIPSTACHPLFSSILTPLLPQTSPLRSSKFTTPILPPFFAKGPPPLLRIRDQEGGGASSQLQPSAPRRPQIATVAATMAATLPGTEPGKRRWKLKDGVGAGKRPE